MTTTTKAKMKSALALGALIGEIHLKMDSS